MVIVLMGVIGSGKTTVGQLLAEKLHAELVEGDAYHPPENIEKMRRGIPLQDADRLRWLEILSVEVDRWLAAARTVVLACSALKQSYCDVLAKGRSGVRFVHLAGEKDLIRRRLGGGRVHYMPASLLDSQFGVLEPPADAIKIDVAGTPEKIVAEIFGSVLSPIEQELAKRYVAEDVAVERPRRVKQRELPAPPLVLSQAPPSHRALGGHDVHFTIYHPKEIVPGGWETLLVYMHLPERKDWVQRDAQSRLERPESHGPKTGRATRSVASGTEIVVAPELPGCRFNPPIDRFLWLEDAHRREFRLQADPAAPGFESGTAVNGRVAFYAASILIGEVTIWTYISDQVAGAVRLVASRPMTSMGLTGGMGVQTVPSGAPRQPLTATAAPFGAIFVSYAHEDSAVVARVVLAVKTLGMSFLRDQEVLRSGEKWHPRLLDLIEWADVFQLYWSTAARRSRYVRQEWRHALQQERDRFILPVYWQEPMPTPPRQLKHLHFDHLPSEALSAATAAP